MKYTPNYNFKKPEPTDTVNIEDFNTSFDLVDEKLGNLDQTFEQLIINAGKENAELVAAHVAADGSVYDKIGDRLDNNESLLASKATQYYVDVKKDFGAKGDGITDDTLSIQNAVNSGKYVKIPPGTYLISSTIVINKGIDDSIVIEGYASEILGNPSNDKLRMVVFKASSSLTGIMFKLTTTRNSRFSNFTIDGGGVSGNFVFTQNGTAQNCLSLEDSPYNIFESINFKGASKSAVRIYGTTYTNSFCNCAFSASLEYGFDSHECLDHCTEWFYNCRFEANMLGGILLTGRLNSFIDCAFEGNIGSGVELGYTGLDTYSNSFYSCDIEGNLGYGMKFNTTVNGITYDGGQIIGDANALQNLFYIQNPLDNMFFKTHLSTLNSKLIYDPTGANIWIRGNFPDNFMGCIRVSNVFWGPLFSKKRDTYVEKVFTMDDISNPINTLTGVGGIITNTNGFKISINGKSISQLTGKASTIDNDIKLRYQRCYNNSDIKTDVVITVPLNADGTFTLNSASGLYGMMDSLYLFMVYDSVATTDKRTTITDLKALLR